MAGFAGPHTTVAEVARGADAALEIASADATRPTVSIHSPEDGSVMKDLPAQISGFAYDAENALVPEVDLVIYQNGQYWNGTAWVDRAEGAPIPVVLPKPAVDGNGSWAFTALPTAGAVRPGTYYINASVRDNTGNASVPVTGTNERSFRIDRTPPSVAIAAPVSGTVLTHTLDGKWVSGSASDPETTVRPEVSIYIQRVSDGQWWGGGRWAYEQSFGNLGAEFTSDTQWSAKSSLPGVGVDSSACMTAGQYKVIAVAKDPAGNEATAETTITVDYTLTLPDYPVLTMQESPLVAADSVGSTTLATLPALPDTDTRDPNAEFLRKDVSGNLFTAVQMWKRQYPAMFPSAAILKHNSNGQLVWRLERQVRSESVTVNGVEGHRYFERFADDQAWIEIDEYSHGGMYAVSAMQTDEAGNVYVGFNMYTIQYRQYATSSSGSPLYANMETLTPHAVIMKFGPDGLPIWRRVIGATDSGMWYPNSAILDLQPLSDGTAAVLLENWQFISNQWGPSYLLPQTAVFRTGPAGVGFIRRYGYGEFDSTPIAIRVDAADNIYAISAENPGSGGYYFATPPPDHVIRKFAMDGTLLRQFRLDHCDAPEAWKDAAIDRTSGELYIAGDHSISMEPTGRQLITKIDLRRPEGTEVLWRSYGPAKSMLPGSPAYIALTPTGVYVASNSSNTGTSSDRQYIVASRFSRDGSFVWSRKYSSPQQTFGDYGDSVDAIRADEAGNLYILGYTPNSSGISQSALWKISSYGDVQFAKLFAEGVMHASNPGELLLLPGTTSPSQIAVLAESPDPGQILTFTNPAVVYPPITVPSDQPANQTVGAGSPVTFTVNAGGSAPLQYQWRKHLANGTVENIAGANSASYTIASAQLSDTAGYSVVVSNAVASSVTSRTAALTVETVVPLQDALDSTSLLFTTGGDRPWRGQNLEAFDGIDAAVSGAIGDSQTSWLETTVTGPGTVKFQWKSSTEQNYDYLRLFIDGQEVASISGDQSWIPYSAFVSEGAHTIRWSYTKDSSSAGGQDRAWVDNVSFSAGEAEPTKITTQPANVSVRKGGTASFTVGAGGTNLSYQWFKDGEEIPWGTDSTLIIGNVQDYDAGKYRVRVTGYSGTELSNEATLTISGDTTPPTITVKSPKANITVQEPSLTISGEASDNKAVASVSVYVERPNTDSGSYIADGTDSWSINVTLAPGVNRIYVSAYDEAGNYSTPVIRTVTYAVPVTLSVSSTGNGSVYEVAGTKLKPVPATSSRLTGKTIYLVGAPEPGFICAGWSLGTDSNIEVAGPVLPLELAGDLAVVAHFVPSPFPALAATYSGIIDGNGAATSGAFTVTLSSGGVLTGKITYGGKSYSLKVPLNADASMEQNVQLADGLAATFSLQINEAGITGSVKLQDQVVASVSGGSVPKFSKKSQPEKMGHYTMLLDDSGSKGVGQAVIDISAKGKVTIIGALAGGETFSTKSVLCAGNRIPVYATFKGGDRALVGWINIVEGNPVLDLNGTLKRFTPEQANGESLSVSGSIQTAAAGTAILSGLESSQGAATLILESETLTPAIELPVMIGTVASKKGKLSLKVTVPGVNAVGLKVGIDPLTGAFGGFLKHPQSGEIVTFAGVLVQKQGLAEGQFQIGSEIGTVTLVPTSSGN